MSFEYVISFNTTDLRFTPQQVHAFITHSKSIDSWHLPFSGTYLVKSSLSTPEMYNMIDPIFNGGLYFLSYVIRQYATGSLQPEAWTWLNSATNDLQKMLG